MRFAVAKYAALIGLAAALAACDTVGDTYDDLFGKPYEEILPGGSPARSLWVIIKDLWYYSLNAASIWVARWRRPEGASRSSAILV